MIFSVYFIDLEDIFLCLFSHLDYVEVQCQCIIPRLVIHFVSTFEPLYAILFLKSNLWDKQDSLSLEEIYISFEISERQDVNFAFLNKNSQIWVTLSLLYFSLI